MSENRRALRATGLAFIALGSVAFVFGMVSWWLSVRQPIAYGMALGGGLALAGIGLIAANRDGSPGTRGTDGTPK
ncbi:hypothetical protein [Tautonia plasticadhaerens]|uniref:Uncharacterized protein n=1 Tax=Tautonia plasticadhaerens TaxID=2527974 RepID=A0A518GXQ7_9BACT|nr:hypothetical protein [Tautonia plasticadhaerens]QDV33371.1 hypothetical protein ElP_12420 [Tautonia plasticadhaerens]